MNLTIILTRVIAKNVGDPFLWYTAYIDRRKLLLT